MEDTDYKKNFIDLLRSTQREGVEYVIEDMEKLGFFEAPASVSHHYNFPGGLVQHSLNTYKAAVALKDGLSSLVPAFKQIKDDSLILATLLHDVCKADIYELMRRKRKNEIGMWETEETYKVSYENFPMGHDEKSLVVLLCSGLVLSDDEMLAIRWHMGPSCVNPDSQEERKSYETARRLYPLVHLTHLADTVAAQLIEETPI